MKKLLFIIFFLFCFLNNTHIVRAKDFQKETPSTKIEASVIGGKIDISIRNKLTSSGGYQKGTLSIYTKKNGNTYLDQIFSKEFTINNGSIEKTSFSGLDSSKKTDYYLVWSGTELPFSTFWYGLSFGNKKGDGGYDITFFGDPKDQRKMFLLLSKSSITNLIGDIFNSTQNNTFIELGKLSSSSTIGTGQKSVSLPTEKHGRYYAYLLAQDVNGEYYPLSSHRETVVFGTLVGEIFYKKLGKSDFEKTGTNQYKLTGIIDASKHKPTDIVPLSSIKVSGAFYDKNTGQRILGIGPVEPKEDGRYEIEIPTNGVLQDNTDYDLILNFSSSTGAEATYKVKGVNTTKGYIIPETGKEAEDFLNKNSYRLLAPIPGMTMLLDPELCKLEQEKNPGEICDINALLNFILQLAIGAAAVVLVVRIIIDGYGYMITDVPFIKAKLKGRFLEAMIGLVIALSSYLILNTVSPKLVSNDIKIGVANFDVESFGDIDANFVPPAGGGASFNKSSFPQGVICPGSGGRSSIRNIAESWQNKATYSQPKRGLSAPNNTFYLDCSSYVATVLECAGIKPPIKATGISTYGIFLQMAGAEKVSPSDFTKSGNKVLVKGRELLPGDLVGWRGVNSSGGTMGHVVIYVGEGMFRESQVGGNNVGNSVQGEKTLEYELKQMSGKNVTQGYIRRISI